MLYVLIIVAGTGYGFAPEVKSIDFATENSCKAAKSQVIAAITQAGRMSGLYYIECVPK